MTRASTPSDRGTRWLHAIANGAPHIATGLGSLLVVDAPLADETARLLAIVPDEQGRFPRARHGEVGLEEGWALARQIRDAVSEDESKPTKRPLVAIVDSRSQAYGRVEELLGIHLSLAAAVDAYASARRAGHPIVALIVGQAISGALLAHGLQAHRMLALHAPGVVVHAMHEAAAARITHRSIGELKELGKTILPMSYDITDYAKLGLLHELIEGVDPDSPSPSQVSLVEGRLTAAIADARAHGGGPLHRLGNPDAARHRAASIAVRQKLAEQWHVR